MQFSVFQCRLSEVRFTRMVDELREVVDPKTDSVIF